ncbi:hypothetical protein RB598_000656 [Gaeumannomyces tritici]
MRTNNVFVAFAAVATGAAAGPGNPGQAIAGRDSIGGSVGHPNQLPAKRQAREETGIIARVSSCANALVAIASAIPRDLELEKSIEEWAAQQTPAPNADVCDIKVPAPLTSKIGEYVKTLDAWGSSNGPAHTSSMSAAGCPVEKFKELDDKVKSAFAELENLCTTTTGGTNSKPTRATSNAVAAATTSSTSSSKDAAPRETGFVAGMVAAVGLLGVVAAL